MLRVVILEPNKAPEVVELVERSEDARLYGLQQLIGGYLEVAMHGKGFVVYCNEEGLMRDLPFNCFRPSDGQPLVGTLVAVKTNVDGEEISMTESDAEKLKILFATMAASRPASLDSATN